MASNLYKTLLKEIRRSSPGGKLKPDSPLVKYVTTQFDKYRTTDELLCKAKDEMKYVGETYLCYLQSLRKQVAITKEYSGKGERSVEETAGLVGFKLPHDPK